VEDGEVLRIGAVELKMLHTPGHTPSPATRSSSAASVVPISAAPTRRKTRSRASPACC
jgi:hypothetical protein